MITLRLIPPRESGWMAVVDHIPNPDTLKFWSMFGVVRKLLAETIFAKREIQALTGSTDLDSAIVAQAEFNSTAPVGGKEGQRVARIQYIGS